MQNVTSCEETTGDLDFPACPSSPIANLNQQESNENSCSDNVHQALVTVNTPSALAAVADDALYDTNGLWK